MVLGGEKQQRGPFGQGVMLPESGEGKVPREQKREGRVCACLCMYPLVFGKREDATLWFWVCIRTSKEILNVC